MKEWLNERVGGGKILSLNYANALALSALFQGEQTTWQAISALLSKSAQGIFFPERGQLIELHASSSHNPYEWRPGVH